MKTTYRDVPDNRPWSILIADVEIPKAPTPKPETAKAKPEIESPLIADARRRAGEVEATNPIIENAKKRAEKAHTEVQSHV